MQKLLAVVVLILVGLIAEASFSPIYRLRANMPPEFVDAPATSSPEKRAAEEKIARAYWDCAVGQVQWRYGYGYRLPHDPPNDFIVASEDLGPMADDAVTRVRYWSKVQNAWYVPDNWTKTYHWDTRWTTDWLDTMKRLVHAT